jgi:hypothetical protein
MDRKWDETGMPAFIRSHCIHKRTQRKTARSSFMVAGPHSKPRDWDVTVTRKSDGADIAELQLRTGPDGEERRVISWFESPDGARFKRATSAPPPDH